jgi:hypothetical protein
MNLTIGGDNVLDSWEAMSYPMFIKSSTKNFLSALGDCDPFDVISHHF